MADEAPHDRMDDDPAEDLFGIEAAAGAEHAVDLGEASWPVGNVVKNAEIEHRVVGGVGHRDRGGVADPDAGAGRPAACPPPRPRSIIEV